MRIAIAHTGKSKDVAQYLPNNFVVLGRTLDNTGTIIVGVDDHGWSLDKYVIPRLGSALIHCEEVIEWNGVNLMQLELNLKLQLEKQGVYDGKPKRGRKPKLDERQVEEIRHTWKENDLAWQTYRSNPTMHAKPFHLTLTDLAVRYRVSAGLITDVIERTGAYAS